MSVAISGFISEYLQHPHVAPLMRATCSFAIAAQTLLRFVRKCYVFGMITAEDVEKAVEQLTPRELARFRAWFEAFEARQFDAAIERDAQAGKLDAHANEAPRRAR